MTVALNRYCLTAARILYRFLFVFFWPPLDIVLVHPLLYSARRRLMSKLQYRVKSTLVVLFHFFCFVLFGCYVCLWTRRDDEIRQMFGPATRYRPSI